MNSRLLYVAAAAMAFGVAACDSTTAPSGLDQADLNQLANDVDVISMAALGDAGASSLSPTYSVFGSDATPLASVNTVNRSFTNTRACPVSGSVTIAGTVVGTSDPVAHNLSITATATKTDAACAFNTKNGVATINGNPNVALTATVNIVAGKPTGLQTMSHKGSFTVSRNGDSRTCDVDVTSTYDPAAGTFTVSGTMCGKTINISRTGPKF